MIELNIARNDNERLALSLLKAMEDGNLIATIEAICTQDFEWANSGLPTLHGQAEIFAHMQAGGFAQMIPILQDMASFSADVGQIASFENVVYTERVDHHWDAEGRDLMTPIISGTIEIRDGKISALRDFYNTECYQQQPSAPDPAHAAN
jgi:limonene-1,2-epoxide hydrolase